MVARTATLSYFFRSKLIFFNIIHPDFWLGHEMFTVFFIYLQREKNHIPGSARSRSGRWTNCGRAMRIHKESLPAGCPMNMI